MAKKTTCVGYGICSVPVCVGCRYGRKGEKRRGPEDQCGGHVGNISAI